MSIPDHIELWCKACQCGVSIIGKDAIGVFIQYGKEKDKPSCKKCEKHFVATIHITTATTATAVKKAVRDEVSASRPPDPEFVKILAQLQHDAGPAGLDKMLDGVHNPAQGWHVTRVEFVRGLCEPGWNVYAQLGNTEQTDWTYVTGSEIFAYCLKIAQEREKMVV